MARGAAQEAPSPPSPPPPPTDAAGDVSTLSTADSSTVATFAVAGADGDTTASCSLEASSSAADDARDAELQQQKARVRTPRVLRRPKLTLEAVDAILAGEDPSTVLPPPPPRKPPLAKTPPAPVPTRKPPVKKRRGRDVPGVEWDESLFHFANCMRIELGELNAEFVANDNITFAAFKQLWKLRRMSAAFHAEFWESSPSTTHQTILQMALDLLVCCVEELSPFESQSAVAALFGFVFALFSAYSLQLGSPKHKIDVDPRSWTALLAIESATTTGLGSMLYPQASKEVLAMLRALEQKENAFLKCLRGFGYQFRVKSGRLATGKKKAAERCRLSVCGLAASDFETLLQQEQVEQLDALRQQYSDSVALVNEKSSTTGAMASAAASLSKPRVGKLGIKHAPVAELSQTHEKSRAELLTRLHSYLKLKSDSAASRLLRFQQQGQEQEIQTLSVESKHSERAESEVAVDDDDFGFEFEEEPVLMELQAPEEALSVNNSTISRNRTAKPAVSQPQLGAKAPQKAKRKPSGFHVGSSSVASSESDGLALLEAELNRGVYSIPPPLELLPPPAKTICPQRASRAKVSLERQAPVRLPLRKRRRSFASTGSAFTVGSETASDGLSELEAELKASVLVQEAKTGGVTGRPSALNRQTASDSDSLSDNSDESDSEFVESDDGLAELEAELEAEVGAVKPKPKAKAKGKKQPTTRKQPTEACQTRAAAPVKRRRLQDTISIATESDGGLAELQAELELSVQEECTTAVVTPATVKKPARTTRNTKSESVTVPSGIAPRGIVTRRMRAASIATESDDEALAELQAELERTAGSKEASEAPLPPVAAKAVRSTRVSLKRKRGAESGEAVVTELQEEAERSMATVRPPRATQARAPSKKPDPPAVAKKPRGIALKRMREVSDAVSIVTTETDDDDGGLAELQAELERSTGAEEPKAVAAETENIKSATQPRRGSRRANSKQVSADAGEHEKASATTNQSTRKRSAAAGANAEEPTSAGKTTPRATRTPRSSATQEANVAEEKGSDASVLPGASRKAPAAAAALGKPPTGKAKGKAKATVAKKPAVSKTKNTTSSSSTKQKRDLEAKATASSSVQASDLVAAPLALAPTPRTTAKPPAAKKASNVSIASTSDGDESDDGLGELEAELQASIA
ncbi:Major facilitator superfamily [Globisporangium polare]